MAPDPLAAFPEELVPHSARKERRYQREGQGFALQGAVPASLRDRVVWTADADLHVLSGTPPAPADLEEGIRIVAVYRHGGDGPDAVPTGRVFVQFTEGSSAASRGDDLRAAGFAIDEVPAYAPHAAWVRPIQGDVATALQDVEHLFELEGVEAYEVQLLKQAQRRRGRRGR